jgi:hypothetical protein
VASKPLDLVKVDPHPFPEQQAPALDHYGERAERRVERVAQPRRVGHRHDAIVARPGAGGVGSLVGDQLRAAGLLLTELEPSPRAREVGVTLFDRAAVLGSEGQRRLERPRRIRVASLQLEVAQGCRQVSAEAIVAPWASASSWSSTRC